MAVEPIRRQRIRSFLRLHLGLVAFALVAWAAEFLSGINDPVFVVTGLVSSLLPLLAILGGFRLLIRERAVNWIIPSILGMDTVLVLGQNFIESGLESGWAATPVLLVFMLPLFSDRRQDVWILAGVQVVVYTAMFTLRWLEVVPYVPREHNGGFLLYTGMGYVFFVVAAALLAGRASADVLNSQRQLEAEIDQATAALKAAQARLVEQDRVAALAQLTAGLAHEINNPLTYVRTNVTNIERDVVDLIDALEAYEALLRSNGHAEAVDDIRDEFCLDDPRELLGELIGDTSQGLDRVKQIIFDLRAFARLDEADRQPLQIEPDLERTLQLLGHRLADGVQIVRDFKSLPVVDGFPALLNQVFSNILHNACDVVSPQQGVIRISTRTEDDDVVIEFADNGPGVPEEARARIFDPFFTTKDVGEGTGLGLSICQRIVSAHGGRIEIETAPEGGALFRVRLPKSGVPAQLRESAA